MNSSDKKTPGLKGIPQQFKRHPGHAHQFRPTIAQSKNATAAPNVRQHIAPPVYRPQSKPNAVQQKTAGPSQMKTHPVAPPAYRPQPPPKVLQRKKAIVQPSHPKQLERKPVAPPVYRPQPVPRVLQTKMVNDRKLPVNHSAHSPVIHREDFPAKSSKAVQLKEQSPAARTRAANVIQPLKHRYKTKKWVPFGSKKDMKAKHEFPGLDVTQDNDVFDDQTGIHSRDKKQVGAITPLITNSASVGSGAMAAPPAKVGSKADDKKDTKEAMVKDQKLAAATEKEERAKKALETYPDKLSIGPSKINFIVKAEPNIQAILYYIPPEGKMTPMKLGVAEKGVKLHAEQQTVNDFKDWLVKDNKRQGEIKAACEAKDAVTGDDALSKQVQAAPRIEIHTTDEPCEELCRPAIINLRVIAGLEKIPIIVYAERLYNNWATAGATVNPIYYVNEKKGWQSGGYNWRTPKAV